MICLNDKWPANSKTIVRQTLACAMILIAGTTGAQSLVAEPVQDLAYGEALFQFYDENYFTAATRILVAQEQGTLPNHSDDASLLLGGLYLSYGQQDEAAEIFSALLDTTRPQVRDRAWLYLAEIAWQRGNPDRAVQALGSIGDGLDDEFLARRELLQARIAIDQQRYDDAVSVLSNWSGGEQLAAYAQFNLGVALIRQGESARGIEYLKAVGGGKFRAPGKSRWRFVDRLKFWSRKKKGDTTIDESTALRDRANLALGYAHLQNDEADLAIGYLQRIRGNGELANKALLGAGWAALEQEQYAKALAFWEPLKKGDRLDPAVQESLLAIPFARHGMGEEQRALNEYQLAIDHFDDEISHLSSFGDKLLEKDFLRTLLLDDDATNMGWFWQLDDIPNSVETRYLYHLIADHEFQEGLKNFRDLSFLQQNLLQWRDNIGAFQGMLEARRARFSQRMVTTPQAAVDDQYESLANRVAQLHQRFEQVSQNKDALALATQLEQENWETLNGIEARLASLPSGKVAQATEKHRLLKGVMQFDLEQSYPVRLWEMRKTSRAVEKELKKSSELSQSLQAAQIFTPERFAGFDLRLAQLEPQIDVLLKRIDVAMGTHERYLAELAEERIEKHKQRLRAYLSEAQFALATTYDRAAKQSEGQ